MTQSQTETCHYIGSAVAELRKLAEAADLQTMSYLLAMAQIEADNVFMASKKSDMAITASREHRKEPAGTLVAFAP